MKHIITQGSKPNTLSNKEGATFLLWFVWNAPQVTHAWTFKYFKKKHVIFSMHQSGMAKGWGQPRAPLTRPRLSPLKSRIVVGPRIRPILIGTKARTSHRSGADPLEACSRPNKKSNTLSLNYIFNYLLLI